MIKFEVDKVRIEHVYIRSVTTALGGACTVVDPDTGDSTRLAIPYSVARRFIKEHKVSTYIVPVLSAVMYYDDIVVAVERHHLGNLGVEESDGLFGKKRWQPHMETFLEKIRDQLSTGDWYVDGSYIYRPTADYKQSSIPLTADGKFHAIFMSAYRFADFQKRLSEKADSTKMMLKYGVKYDTGCGIEVISPPIWKDSRSITKHDNHANAFDTINSRLLVNLNFALNAATELSTSFGYQSIEPLGLDDLMVKLKTVNLPTLATHIKKTCEIGMSYTHTFAWLLGFVYRSKSLEQLMNVRALIKYLSSTGTYEKRKLKNTAFFKAGVGINDIPRLNVDNMLEAVSNKTVVNI